MSRQPRLPLPGAGPSASAGYSSIDSPRSNSSRTQSPAGNYGGHSPLNPSRGNVGGGNSYSHHQQQQQPWQAQRDSDSDRSASSIDHRGTLAVMTGQVGGGYGPYSYEPNGQGRYSPRSSSQPSPFATRPSPSSSSSGHGSSSHNSQQHQQRRTGGKTGAGITAGPTWTARDAEMDDKLHNPSPHDKMGDRTQCTPWSIRGWLNMTALFVMVAALVTLFAGYPIIQFYQRGTAKTYGAYNVGGINSTGQVPDIPNLPSLIDADTPASALTRTGFDGHDYVLVFSDEFNTDGRTFWPGDDPFWEAVDLHYWATADFEWYDPDAITTKGGALVITVSEEPIHNLNFRSGMLQSWNKFCFTGGYIEVSIQLPGIGSVGGFWPGAWTLGNLARAGYGATTDGTWPYSYNSCDLGTLPNQTNVAGTGPAAALNIDINDGGQLSQLPGQRLSACTCSGEDHPGPNVGVGRGAPEVDIIEAGVGWRNGGFHGSVSQSAQFAPFDANYAYVNTTPATTVYDDTVTSINSYTGGVYQEAVSGVSFVNGNAYELQGQQFASYGWEMWPDQNNGFITWQVSGKPTWQITSATVGPNAAAGVGQRLISQEPMYIILNLGIASSFQPVSYGQLKFPAHMKVDYVRVYQRSGSENIGCDPPNMPTADYINKHMNAYTNPNYTLWSQAGYQKPKNSMTGC
ncbi:beta-glucan synthesis-associated [Meredithblackwellia eburnea MCA 4105]